MEKEKKKNEMKTLELSIFKVLVDLITLNEFESIIYQEQYVEKMESNDFIAKVITINYRGVHWKRELENLIYDLWDDSKYLAYLLRKYCEQIIASEDSEKVFNIVNDIARLNVKHDYEYGTLMQFYLFEDDLDLITSGYSNLSERELVLEIKTYSKLYMDTYDYCNVDYNVVLNLRDDKIETVRQNEKLSASNTIKKVAERKKWFQFWK